MFAWTFCSCGLFEFTPRRNTILNIEGAWFALMFLWIFCKESEFSYFVAQTHDFKCKLDEVFANLIKYFVTWASLMQIRHCCLSRDCRARASIKTAKLGVREYLPVLALVKAVFV